MTGPTHVDKNVTAVARSDGVVIAVALGNTLERELERTRRDRLAC